MKNKLILGVLLISTSVFANNIKLMEKINNSKYDIQSQSEPIGISAKLNFTNKKDMLGYIKQECTNILPNFEYLGDKELVKDVVFPNCIEYAMEKLK